MSSPLAPKPIVPSLRPHAVARATPDRRRRGRSFREELAGEGEGHEEPGPAPSAPSARPESPGHPATAAESDVGHLLDLEA